LAKNAESKKSLGNFAKICQNEIDSQRKPIAQEKHYDKISVLTIWYMDCQSQHMRTGQISVQSENIFPIIKKFLYTDQEIFLRELVSNAVDATKKLSTLSRVGEFEDSIEKCKVEISFDEKAKTLTISDSGIGMTEEEVEKYITQLAFSGAREFAEQWKDKDPDQMIGHFGLGFYSAFMVSKMVTIETKSYQKGSDAVHWDCDGATSYNIGKGKRKKRGTDVILHLTDEDAETYLSKWKLRELLRKYCRFLPVPITFDGEDINNTQPIWTKKPAELESEDYKKFFEELYPAQEAPLFNIHINTDYPFNLTGVLYFPKVNEAIDNRQNRVQLYCNQVFVTEDVKFVKYGMVADEKFAERTKDICLLKTTDGKLNTIQEWIDHAKINQTDKNGETVVLYSTDVNVQHMNIKAAKDKGYEVVVLNGPLDTHFAGWVEGKFEKVKFRCVDGGPMDQLIEKEVTIESVLSEDQRKTLEDSVKAVVNELAFDVKIESLPPQDDFISVHRNEWERRMEDMAKMGNGFPYGNMGLNKQTMVVNTNHALASKVLGKEGDSRNELLQYCMDLAMLQRGQLQGESLERFVKKAQGFIMD